MIFVTIGTVPFPRLIKAMDEIAGKTDEKVVMQIGYTRYLPQNAEFFDFTGHDGIVKLMKQSRLVVCHDGVGSIITALQCSRPIVAVPRLKGFGESFYENKSEVTSLLAGEGKLRVVYEVDEIRQAILEVSEQPSCPKNDGPIGLVSAIKDYISTLWSEPV